MNIQAEKIEIMKLIMGTEDPFILESVKNLFKKDPHSDFWATLSQDQKDDILQGIKDIENGEVTDYEDFMRKFR
jgi:hypothetical protein